MTTAAPNLPTALVIATSPETGGAPLEAHIETLAALGLHRLVVVAPQDTKPALERLRDVLQVHLRFVASPASLPDAFVAAEPSLAHFAAGPVVVTQPSYAVEPRLYADLLDAWTNRPSGVEGIIATAEAREPRGGILRLLLEGERLTRCLLDGDSPGDGEVREYVGAMTYSWSRELCETIGEEAGKRGHRDAVALGLNRLMAWNNVRNLAYNGPWQHDVSNFTPRARLTSSPGETSRLQRPYSPR